jgi:hypothetical protein
MSTKDSFAHKIAASLAVQAELQRRFPKPRQNGPKYSGVLNEPMLVRAPEAGGGLLEISPSVSEQESADRKLEEQLIARLEALYRHYNIDPLVAGADFQLVAALATTHIPGFRYALEPKKRRGAPDKWRGSKGLELLGDVMVLLGKGKSALSACRILATNRKYAGRYDGETPKNLYRRYQELKSLGEKRGPLGRALKKAKAEGAPVEDWLAKTYSFEAEKAASDSHDLGGKSKLKTRTTK